MINAEIFGWLGTVAICVGSILIAHKRSSGFWVMLAGNVCFMWSGALGGLISLMAVSGFVATLNIYSLWKWEKDETR